MFRVIPCFVRSAGVVGALVLACLAWTAPAAQAQSGGFLASATDTGLRAPITNGQTESFVPARGVFTFPAPYNTLGVRLTNADDCGGSDCVNYVGYSYWRNINNHAGSDTMLVFLGLKGRGPTLFTYNKKTGETRNAGPLFASGTSLASATGEGWYFSATRPTALYVNDGPRMMRYDVMARTFETVYDVTQHLGAGRYIWQMHSSNDDRVHSATVKDSSTYRNLGCGVYREDTRQYRLIPAVGEFDECQVDKSGRWVVIKEDVDGQHGEDNRIIDLETGAEQVYYDHEGNAGHSDVGYGYIVGEDNFANQPGATRVWRFDQPKNASGQGRLVYQISSWSADLGHLAHSNARAGVPLEQQIACSSNANRNQLPRVNEIVCYRLDGSLRTLVVAPNMTDLNAAGGGSDDYSKRPKGNLDVTGEYFIWTSNRGGNRADAFIVRVPLHLLSSSSSPAPPPEPAPTPAPTPTPTPSPTPAPSPSPTPTPGPVAGETVKWLSLVRVSASDRNLQKSGGCDGCEDASAVSEGLISTTGHIEFTVPDAAGLRYVGLAPSGPGTRAADLPFAIRIQGGVAEVRERNSYKREISAGAGDVLRIAVENGTVKYAKNGAVFYTSGSQITTGHRLHVVFFNSGAAIHNVTMGQAGSSTSPVSPAPQPSPAPSPTQSTPVAVKWTSLVNAAVSGSNVVKTGGCDGCPDASAVSDQTIAGNGYFEFTAAEASSLRFVGLAAGGVGTAAGSLTFALRLQGGVVEVRESGSYKTESSFAATDTFRISVASGVVTYSRNGTVFYRSTLAAPPSLRAHAVFFNAGGAIGNPRILVGAF